MARMFYRKKIHRSKAVKYCQKNHLIIQKHINKACEPAYSYLKPSFKSTSDILNLVLMKSVFETEIP